MAALTTALLHDNDAAIAELNRIGNQDNIIRETFIGVAEAMGRELDSFLTNWRAYLAIGAVYVGPPVLCAALWTATMRRLGRWLFKPSWLDTAAAVVATLTPLAFLSVAFDLSRLMAWTYSRSSWWPSSGCSRRTAAAMPAPGRSGRGRRSRSPSRRCS